MNLIIDVGNTLIKFAVFQGDMILEKNSAEDKDALKTAKEIINKYPLLRKAIISSVGKLKKPVFDFVDERLDLLFLNSDSKLPFKNLYQTPQTLGMDRIALVSASARQYPNANVLVIDVGTCITYDFINSKNEYLGGAISPGIRLRYQALHNLTVNLPLLDIEMPEGLTGNSTSSAIHSGVVFGIIKEIDGIVCDYKDEYEDLTVILTGGDANFLSKQLKNSIFANSNFLLEGLNFLLEFNSH